MRETAYPDFKTFSSAQRPQRAQKSANSAAASSLLPISAAARGGIGRGPNSLPSWRDRYRRIGPTRCLRQVLALANSGRVASSTNNNSCDTPSRDTQAPPRAAGRPSRQRPHARQFSSKSSTAPQ